MVSDVGVQANDFHAEDFLHDGFEQEAAMFDEFKPHLLDEVTSPALLFHLHQLLLGWG